MSREEKGKYLKLSESFFSETWRHEIVAEAIGQHEFYVMGLLTKLWNICLSRKQHTVTTKELSMWLRGKHDPDLLIQGLLDEGAHYLEKASEGRYKVVGIDWRVQIMDSISAERKKAAEARWSKRNANAMQSDAPLSENEKEREKEKEIEKNPPLGDAKKSDSPPAQTPPKSKSKKKSTQRPLMETWEPDHRWAGTFALLTKVAPYAAVFGLKRDSQILDEHAKRYSLTCAEIEQVAYDYAQKYSNGSKEVYKLKNPRSTLNTFMRNAATWKAEKEANKKPETPQEVNRRINKRINDDYIAVNGEDEEDGWK